MVYTKSQGCLLNIGNINECTSGSCTVALGLLRDNGTHGIVETFLEMNIAEGSGLDNYWILVLEGTGDFGSRTDVMMWLSVPTPWSLQSRHPLQPLLLIPSVLIWILDNQDKNTLSLLSKTYVLQRAALRLDISSGLFLPPRLLFNSVV